MNFNDALLIYKQIWKTRRIDYFFAAVLYKRHIKLIGKEISPLRNFTPPCCVKKLRSRWHLGPLFTVFISVAWLYVYAIVRGYCGLDLQSISLLVTDLALETLIGAWSPIRVDLYNAIVLQVDLQTWISFRANFQGSVTSHCVLAACWAKVYPGRLLLIFWL